jgi:hypothetical protein
LFPEKETGCFFVFHSKLRLIKNSTVTVAVALVVLLFSGMAVGCSSSGSGETKAISNVSSGDSSSEETKAEEQSDKIGFILIPYSFQKHSKLYLKRCKNVKGIAHVLTKIYKKYGEIVKGNDIRCTFLIKRVVRNANF